MAITINGTTGISGVDGSAVTPALQGADANTGISFGTDTVTINTGGVARVTTDASGNVGVGTSSPNSNSFWNKAVSLNSASATSAAYELRENGSLLGYWSTVAGGGTTLYSYTAHPLVFGTNNTERMRIDSVGTLILGGTTGVTALTRMVVRFAGGGSQYGIGMRPATDTTSAIWFENAAGTNIGQISITASSTAYVTSSDYRLKEQVAPMTGALAKNELLNPVTYKWKSTGENGQGFIAHELQAVFPDAVTGEKDAVDAEGSPVYQGVDTSFLVGHLVACVKELKAELDSVKAELATLKGAA